MTLDPDTILNVLAPDGPLSHTIKGFESRQEQQHMLRNIIEAYNNNEIALIEAGTGTGKSLAYLLPALYWAIQQRERTVISTNTINLQEQLIFKDIPMLTKALNLKVKAVLVKGMSNYLCLRKFEEACEDAGVLPLSDAKEIADIEAWQKKTTDGSRSTLSFVPSPQVWERVCAEADTCSYNTCPCREDCFFLKARRRAADAQILVANHHLLFADLTARSESENYEEQAVLPAYTKVILDEAHNIEDVATEYFGSRVNRIEMIRTLSKIASERSTNGKPSGKLPILKEKIQKCYDKDPDEKIKSILARLDNDIPAMRQDLYHNINDTFLSFETFMKKVSIASDNTEENKLRLLPHLLGHPYWTDDVTIASKRLIDGIKGYVQTIESLLTDIQDLKNDRLNEFVGSLYTDTQAFANRLLNAAQTLEDFVKSEYSDERVRWMETRKIKSGTNITLIDTALNISQQLIDALYSKFSTVILCSATLTTNREFTFFRQRLGLSGSSPRITENAYESPFDYQQQAMLVIPKDLPNPTSPDFIDNAIESIWNAIKASRGNAFVLFTSYSMMKLAHNKMADRLDKAGYLVLKQGDDNRKNLLEIFKKTDYSVLFGTDSFWEGVDVAGESLRCVIIVKLPFKVPTEPIIQARTEAITARGGSPFYEFTVPNAIVKFKQGFGRLIRNKKDRGCIVCLDSRLLSKNYGKMFLNSLPQCKQACDGADTLYDTMHAFYRKTFHKTKDQWSKNSPPQKQPLGKCHDL